MSGGYKIGKNRPPEHSRFKPGQSGNPGGRPKGSRNATSTLLLALNQKITVTDQKRRRKVSKYEAGATQLANKVANGDFKSLQFATEIMMLAEMQSQSGEAPTPAQQRERDLAILKVMRDRMGLLGDDDGE